MDNEPTLDEGTIGRDSVAPSAIAMALEEPSLVAFYIPILWPIAVRDASSFTNVRQESLPFDPPVQFPAWLGPLDPDKRPNFVVITLHQFAHSETYDFQYIDNSMRLASRMTGGGFGHTPTGEREVPRNAIDSEGNQLEFGRVPPPGSNQSMAVAELVTPVFDDPADDFDPLSRAFNRCVEELNIVEAAYAITSHDVQVRYTNRVTCVPIVPIAMFRNDGTVFFKGAMHINLGLHLVPYDREELTIDQMHDMAVRVQLFKNGQPLIRYAERSLSATRALENDGDYAAAVLWAYTAGEILLDALLLMMAWEEITFAQNSSLTLDEVVGWFSGRSTLSGRIDSYYHIRLKGGWHPGIVSSPLAGWSTEVASLRNLVVHAGYMPTEQEAATAIETLGNLEEFVKSIISDERNRGRYPRTVMILGIPGLERRGLMGGKLKRLLESDQVDWQQSFREFREKFRLALALTRPTKRRASATGGLGI